MRATGSGARPKWPLWTSGQTHFWTLLLKCGYLDRLAAVEWGHVERLVFVCKGNICRSPYAEARARTLGLSAASWGLEAGTSLPADSTAVKVAARRYVDLARHRTRSVGDIGVRCGDVLIGMEPGHLRRLRRLSKAAPAQITLLGLWSPDPIPSISDPYGLADEYFDACFASIDVAVDNIASHLGRITSRRGNEPELAQPLPCPGL